jgi:mobilization protein NikA
MKAKHSSDAVSRQSKGGRPRLPVDALRGKTLPPVRVTASELAEVQSRAARLGVAPSEFIRRTVLGRRMPSHSVPPINREAWAKLGPLAANLNQYVKAIHQGQAAGAPLELLEQLRLAVVALRKEILGNDSED